MSCMRDIYKTQMNGRRDHWVAIAASGWGSVAAPIPKAFGVYAWCTAVLLVQVFRCPGCCTARQTAAKHNFVW